MSLTPTPHNSAVKGEIAKTVLMPGDPMRAKFIAETFLENAVLVNNVRGVQGYTGSWKGTPVTVMASGMGIPSIGIYSHELYHNYDVDNIIRIGTAGGLADDLDLRDVLLGLGACTNSAYADQFCLNGTFAPIASWELVAAALAAAEELGLSTRVGNLLSVDTYYHADPEFNDRWKALGVLAVEMEAAGLYLNAAEAGKRALTICTVSNHIYTGEEMPTEDREKGLVNMITLALDTAHRMAQGA